MVSTKQVAEVNTFIIFCIKLSSQMQQDERARKHGHVLPLLRWQRAVGALTSVGWCCRHGSGDVVAGNASVACAIRSRRCGRPCTAMRRRVRSNTKQRHQILALVVAISVAGFRSSTYSPILSKLLSREIQGSGRISLRSVALTFL